MIVGNKLKNLRLATGLSAEQVAQAVDISQSYLSRFERNKAIPNIDILGRLCKFYNITLSEFFHDEKTNNEIGYYKLIVNAKTLTPDQLNILNQIVEQFKKGDNN